MKINQLLLPLGLTILLLLSLEVITTSVVFAFGIQNFFFPFDLLIILYLSFRVDSHFTGFFILILELFHSVFSVEGWALGTFAGILISIVIVYLKELLHFSSPLATFVIVQISQILWALIVIPILCLKQGDFSHFLDRFLGFLPESFVMALIAPVFFKILAKIWKYNYEGAEAV